MRSHFVENDGWPFLKSASVLNTQFLGMAACQTVPTAPPRTAHPTAPPEFCSSPLTALVCPLVLPPSTPYPVTRAILKNSNLIKWCPSLPQIILVFLNCPRDQARPPGSLPAWPGPTQSPCYPVAEPLRDQFCHQEEGQTGGSRWLRPSGGQWSQGHLGWSGMSMKEQN